MTLTEIGHAIKLAAHARGLVFREIPNKVVKDAHDQTIAQLQQRASDPGISENSRKRALYTLIVKRDIDLCISAQVCRMSPRAETPGNGGFVDYAADVLAGRSRRDARITLVYSASGDGRHYDIVGIASWGTSKARYVLQGLDDDSDWQWKGVEYEVDLVNDKLNEFMATKEIAEIDLMCTRQVGTKNRQATANRPAARATTKAPPTTGSLLMAWVLYRIASCKKAGTPRYKAVLTHLGHRGVAANREWPLRGIVTRAEFTGCRAKMRLNPDGVPTVLPAVLEDPDDAESRRYYYVLQSPKRMRILNVPRKPPRTNRNKYKYTTVWTTDWHDNIVNLLPPIDDIAACPTQMRSGRSYCV